MRDKLIDIILAALNPGMVCNYCSVAADYYSVLEAAMQSRRGLAGKIADALIAEGVMLAQPIDDPYGHADPVGAEGAEGEEGVEGAQGTWVRVGVLRRRRDSGCEKS